MSVIDEMIQNVSKAQKISVYNLCKYRNVLEKSFNDHLWDEYFELIDYQRGNMKMDVQLDRYQGLSIEDYENMRISVLNAVKDDDKDAQKSAEMIINCGEKLQRAAFFINYHRAVQNSCKVFFMIQVCEKMIKAGASLSEVLKYVPVYIPFK